MFKLTVQDTFSISGLGMVAVGKIESGSVRKGDEIVLVSGEKKRTVRVLSIEKFAATLVEAAAGPDDIGICISDVARGELKNGDVLTGP